MRVCIYERKKKMTYVDWVRRTYATFPEFDDEDTLVFYRGLRLAQTMRTTRRLTLGWRID
jgi:hypothetical protein